MDYDVVLIHPPAIYDFREQAIFPDPIAYTAADSTEQFIIPPIGMLSIADYLDRNGYKVVVDNIGDRMTASTSFDAEKHIADLSARVYAIDLHWCVHSQGAIEVARLCKRLHPDALVVLGGLTATVFHDEIVGKYEFVDAVIRGEAEKPFVSLMKALEQGRELEGVPNLTFRDASGGITVAPLMPPSADLDEYEFTRFDLLEPKRSVLGPGWPPHWTIPICRGCLHNCVACGASAYSYKKYFGREKPAFRSPEKIAQDIRKLKEQGVQYIFLCQDPRMGGKDYWSRLLGRLQKEDIQPVHLGMDLFGPANKDYIAEIAKINTPIALTFSPESGVDSVRKAHGRNYTNEQMFRTIKNCQEYGVPIGIFTMIVLANDTPETIRETWQLWEQICKIGFTDRGISPIYYVFGQMILLDPGSRAFDSPESYGYHLKFKTLQDYYQAMSLPSWHQWISYETQSLDRDAIAKLIIDSIEYSTNLREKYGVYDKPTAAAQRFRFVTANKLAIDAVNEAMKLDTDERNKRLKSLREFLDSKQREISAPGTRHS